VGNSSSGGDSWLVFAGFALRRLADRVLTKLTR